MKMKELFAKNFHSVQNMYPRGDPKDQTVDPGDLQRDHDPAPLEFHP